MIEFVEESPACEERWEPVELKEEGQTLFQRAVIKAIIEDLRNDDGNGLAKMIAERLGG